jgi:hypothetical protein
MRMMIRVLMFFWIFFTAVSLCGQEQFDLNHKAIRKEMERVLGAPNYGLTAFFQVDTAPLKGNYYEISDLNSPLGYLYIGRVNSCRAGGCAISYGDTLSGSFEYFDYLIIFDTTANIRSVKIFNYQSTHGQEICNRGWLKQFTGYNGDHKLEVGKDIDAISGATISVYNLTFDIENVSYQLKENNTRKNAQGTRLPGTPATVRKENTLGSTADSRNHGG